MTPEALERVVGWTALHQAAARGDVELVSALLDAGHDMNAAAADGFTPFLVAVHLRHADVVTLLRERGAGTGTTFPVATTRVAAMTGDPATVRALFGPAAPRLDDEDAALFFVGCHERRGHRVVPLADGYERDGPFDSSWADPACGITGPLTLDEEERAIVRAGGNSSSAWVGGFSFRRVAPKARAKRTFTVEVLRGRWREEIYAVDVARIFLGAITHPPERLAVLLAHAARRGHIEVIEALEPLVADRARAVIAAAEGDQVDVLQRWEHLLHVRHPETKRLALGAAAAAGAPRATGFLLERGHDVERAGHTNTTPLGLAAGGTGPAALDTVITLLEHGAKVNAGRSRLTPLMRAVRGGDPAIVERLLAAGARVSARGIGGTTALHEAMEYHDAKAPIDVVISTVEVLLGYGADLHAADDKGRTPVDVVRAREDPRGLELARHVEQATLRSTT